MIMHAFFAIIFVLSIIVKIVFILAVSLFFLSLILKKEYIKEKTVFRLLFIGLALESSVCLLAYFLKL